MDTQKILSYENARQQVYQNLAECYRPPEAAIRSTVDNLFLQLSILESDAVSHVESMRFELEKNGDPELLKVEFSRLFVGPYSLPAPPYGSVYLEKKREVMGDSTLDVQKRYRAYGLDLSPGIKDVPDHIAIELEFMFFLVYKEIYAVRSGFTGLLHEILLYQKSFLADHLGEWVPDFTDCIITYSRMPFYHHLAKVTRTFIQDDLDRLEAVFVPAIKQ